MSVHSAFATHCRADPSRVNAAFLLADVASELALFAAAGFLLFALDDLAVDLIYFGRRLWRALTVYTRFPRAFASQPGDAVEAPVHRDLRPRLGRSRP